VEKYQFNLLMWLSLSDQEAKVASSWYQGAGWYLNPLDAAGKALPARRVAMSEPSKNPVPLSGQLEALNQCGQDGWSVAAFVAEKPAGLLRGVFQVFGPDFSPDGPYFILQRRSA
jgi:hypothetical protein